MTLIIIIVIVAALAALGLFIRWAVIRPSISPGQRKQLPSAWDAAPPGNPTFTPHATPPGMSFREVSRTRPVKLIPPPPQPTAAPRQAYGRRPLATKRGAQGTGTQGFGTTRVNTSAYCTQTGDLVAECGCTRCAAARKKA